MGAEPHPEGYFSCDRRWIMNIAEWPIRKPLAIFAAALVGVSVGCCLFRGTDLPDNLTTLIQWFGGLTILAYYTSSTTEAVKGVGSNAYDEEEMDTVGRSVYADPRGDSGVYDPSDPSASADSSDGRRSASSPRGFIGKYPKGRKHLR